MLNHTGKKSINCNKCDYACYRAPGLRKHLMINSEEKPHKCNQCENTFALKDSLKIHLKNVILERNHLSVTNTTVCVTAGILRSHNKTHFGGKLYICKQ